MASSLGPNAVARPQSAAPWPGAHGSGAGIRLVHRSLSDRGPRPSPGLGAGLALALVAPGLAAGFTLASPAVAGPVVCVSSLEAPLPPKGASAGQPSSQVPVVVTRCGPVVTTPQLVDRRAYTWTAPFAQGVDLVHQVTDVLGVAVAGRNGNTVMGLGFPDQTLVWDATAIESTNRVLLEAQSNPMPLRTADGFNGYCSGLAQGGCGLPVAQESPAPAPLAPGPALAAGPVRGLW